MSSGAVARIHTLPLCLTPVSAAPALLLLKIEAPVMNTRFPPASVPLGAARLAPVLSPQNSAWLKTLKASNLWMLCRARLSPD